MLINAHQSTDVTRIVASAEDRQTVWDFPGSAVFHALLLAC